MKKILVSLMVLALCVPAMAGTITFGTPVITNGQVDIPWTADEGIVGIALTVTASSGVIDTVAVDSFFDVFVDSAFTAGSGYTIGSGIPTAIQGAAGELALPSATFSVSVAGLDDNGIGNTADGEEAPLSGTITLTSDAGATIDICEDTLRGGAVAYSGSMTIAGLCLDDLVIPPFIEPDCWTGDAASRIQFESVGSPEGWCASVNARQCHGDTDGLASGKNNWWVSTPDLNVLSAAWNKPYGDIAGLAVNGVPLINADFDHLPSGKAAWRVSTPDLNILVAGWNKNNLPAPTCTDATGVQP